MHVSVHYDYTTVGHVTIDILADGTRRAGGSAFYSALQAARLGQRAHVLTRGVPEEVRALLEPHRRELSLEVLPATSTTALQTSGAGAGRRQRVLAWAGPIAGDRELDTTILHLAPIARETPRSWRGRAGFVGLTPQGLARTWGGEGAEMTLGGDGPAALAPARWDALVVSERERAACAGLIERSRSLGAVAAITAQDAPTKVLEPDGPPVLCDVAPAARVRDDLGAGDVFAAALFVALREGRGAEEAARFASAAAALRVEGLGARSIAARAEVERRLQDSAPRLAPSAHEGGSPANGARRRPPP
ncbi:MAG TPA: PfkB family carbohydrate kinase [Solirubrobacteraceae bacterium]|nr:PfkB family carbohydrate kinase [Solirubrobacteraceae bacterium]